jgi:hypothetical protein
VIDSPTQDLTIFVGDWVEFEGTSDDPDGDLPLDYLWQFGTGSGIPDANVEEPGLVQFNNPGIFTVTFTVIDSLKLADPTPATVTISVQNVSAGQLIPDWSNVVDTPFNLMDPPTVTNPVLTAADVTDVAAIFVADPFLFYESGLWYMFFEIFNSTSGHGDIGLATSSDGLEWDYERVVLAEGFHHSYPFVFKYGGTHYMIPESYVTNEVRIYVATDFPYEWNYLSTLISGRDFVDPSIIRYNDKWWMFVSDTNESNCYLYYSDNLTSGWIEHPVSPIVTADSNRARPGGRPLLLAEDRIFQIAQNGVEVTVFEIDLLTETQYSEHEISESPILTQSGNGWNALGMHHFDPWLAGNNWLCAVDGNYGGLTWSIGIFTSRVGPPLNPEQSIWSLLYTDSEELAGENGAAVNAFDGDVNTIWHTEWSANNPPPPHEIQIDLGASYEVDGFRYLPRQDGGINGTIADYEFYVSENTANWGAPVAAGTFANNTSEKEVSFVPKTGRFVRFRALSEVNENPWTSVGEINVLGSLAQGG